MGDVKMENLSLWVNLISNVGFPIIIAILLLRNLMSSIQERLDELNKTRHERAIRNYKKTE
jgi:hypothetical protein